MTSSALTTASDADLVARSRRHDAAAFGSLVERHQQLVFGVALARCRDQALAQDVTQDAFIIAWRGLDQLRDADRVGTWMAGIARNLASSATRTRRTPTSELVAPAPIPTPQDELLDGEDRELLHRALAEVPEAHREVLVLYYLEGQSIARIAAGLGVREDVIKQRMSRGRRALREGVAARVESALARVRPRVGLCAGVVAAIAALGSKQVSAHGAVGKSSTTMPVKTKIAIAAVATLVAGGGAATWVSARSSAPASAQDRPARPATAPDGTPDAPHHVRRLHDPTQRPKLLEQIRAASQSRAAAAAAHAQPALPVTTAGAVAPLTERDYLAEIVPLLKECYTERLELDPALAGLVVATFTIEGDPEVGGVVGDAKILDESTIKDPELLECIRETLYGLEVDPPEGGDLLVRTTIEFSNKPHG